jgi:fucose 4-O-acetylase-like acetyltransferase
MTPTKTGPGRVDWMDTLRGITIILVVFEHATRFTARTGFEMPYAVDLLSDAFNPIRMPAMTFLAGLLLQLSLAKGTRTYLAGKLRAILWPFFLWSMVYTALLVLVGGTSGLEHDWTQFLTVVQDPPGHMWFLRDLFAFFVLMLAFRRVPRPLLAGAALALSGIAMTFFTEVDNNNQQVPRFLFLFAFFALGDWAAAHRNLWPLVLERRLPAALAVATALASLPIAWAVGNMRYEVASIPVVLGGIVALTLLAKAASRTPLSAPLRFLGRDSIVIYLLHWLVLAATVQALERFVPGIPGGAVVAIALVTGLVLSAIAIPVHRRLGLGWLFAFPSRRISMPAALHGGTALPQGRP